MFQNIKILVYYLSDPGLKFFLDMNRVFSSIHIVHKSLLNIISFYLIFFLENLPDLSLIVILKLPLVAIVNG